LRPIGDGGFDKESFDEWWARNGPGFANLHPQIVEQWVYRHWTYAHFQFLELHRLTWSVKQMSTVEFLRDVHLEFGGPADPDHDFHVFSGAFGTRKTATAENWQHGTWTIPPVALSTPNGVVGHEGPDPSVRMVLVEGSLRFRWLNALRDRGEETGPHIIYLLEDTRH
jgi:hypothetical protein